MDFDKKIVIPSFVNQLSDEELKKMIKNIASGNTTVYAEVKDSNNKNIGYKEVYLKDKKIELLEEQKKLLKNSKSNKKKYKKAIEEINSYQSFTMAFDGYEESNSNVMCWKAEIAQTARDIEPYVLKKEKNN